MAPLLTREQRIGLYALSLAVWVGGTLLVAYWLLTVRPTSLWESLALGLGMVVVVFIGTRMAVRVGLGLYRVLRRKA